MELYLHFSNKPSWRGAELKKCTGTNLPFLQGWYHEAGKRGCRDRNYCARLFYFFRTLLQWASLSLCFTSTLECENCALQHDDVLLVHELSSIARCFICERRSRGSSVIIVTRLRDGRPRFDSRQRQGFSMFATASRPDLRLTQSRIQCAPGVLCTGIKRPGRETDHSPPSSTEVRNVWSYTPTPPICPSA
jgi:hypothetical protein